MDEHIKIIEIGGIKMEVDMRHAKVSRVATFKAGDRVKLLKKASTYSTASVYNGIIVGFTPFTDLPTITVAYIEVSYNSLSVKFVEFNGKTEGWEMLLADDDDSLGIDKNEMLLILDKEIAQAKATVTSIIERKAWFLKNFAVYWHHTDAIYEAAEQAKAEAAAARAEYLNAPPTPTTKPVGLTVG